jgi:hypothetical protein
MKISKAYRLDSLAVERLEFLSKQAHVSQTALLEELIHACFDEAWEKYPVKPENKGFDRFTNTMRDRVKITEKN